MATLSRAKDRLRKKLEKSRSDEKSEKADSRDQSAKRKRKNQNSADSSQNSVTQPSDKKASKDSVTGSQSKQSSSAATRRAPRQNDGTPQDSSNERDVQTGSTPQDRENGDKNVDDSSVKDRSEKESRTDRDQNEKSSAKSASRQNRRPDLGGSEVNSGSSKSRESQSGGISDSEPIRPGVHPLPAVSQTDFDINNPLPIGRQVLLEASAGTGKTYSLTSLVARYVAEKGLRIEQLLMVTFTKAAASEMRERTRAKLNEALSALERDLDAGSLEKDIQWAKQIVSCEAEERLLRIARLRDAVSNIDSATITTIHGFFQQALRDVGLRSIDTALSEIAEADQSIARQLIRDELVRRFSEGEVSLMKSMPDKTPSDLEAKVMEVLGALESNISAVEAPWKEDGTNAYNWSAFIREIRERISTARRTSGQMSFDDLISGLRDLLEPDNPLREEIIRDLRQRYRLVLIDEFQDTDDTQWSVFSQIFDSNFIKESAKSPDREGSFFAMIMVGDPKQAIYRFRGADIAAYLRVSADPDLLRFEMKRNFRSDRNLLIGLNRWLSKPSESAGEPRGFKFGHPQISYIQVDAAKAGDGSSLRIEGAPDSARALQLRWISTDIKPAPLVNQLRPRIAEDLADHIALLLNNGSLPSGNGERRPIVPNDISILVRNHNDAEPIVEVLRSRGIAVVKSSIGSVLHSDAVEQIRVILLAMAHPNDSRRVKAAALTWFFNFALEDLLDEREIIALSIKMNDWADLLLERGIVELFQTIKSEPSVILELSKSSEFERRMTDLEHIVELLHREVSGKRLPASSLLRKLVDMARVEEVSDVAVRRIDTDAKAIQITTMHASKGLEYPIVLVPYPKGPLLKGPSVFTYQDRRYVDAAPNDEWTIDGLTSETRDALALDEIQGDDLRLMYVAFTRAKHQLVVWWAKSRGVEKGPLARLLFGDHEEISQPTKVLDGELARRTFFELQQKIGIDEEGELLMDVRELGLSSETTINPVNKAHEFVERGSVSVFPANARERFGYSRWSYSSLVKSVKKESSDLQRGGLDEMHAAQQLINGIEDHESKSLSGRLLDMPASSDFGTLVHEVLEKVNFESSQLRDDLLRVLDNRVSPVLREVDIPTLTDGLLDSLHTPLGPVLPDFNLGVLHSRDRLAEMDFHLSLGNGPISTAKIAQIAAQETGSVFASYFSHLAQSMEDKGGRQIDGLLTGSIDILFRAKIEDRTKYYVADYKSNRLHVPSRPVFESSYGFESMKNSMEANHYPLQALVYCVALHRFLESKLDNYDIETDLGGALYLFVRGMVGPDTPVVNGVRNGVFCWRPKSETICEINDLFSGGQ